VKGNPGCSRFVRDVVRLAAVPGPRACFDDLGGGREEVELNR